MTDVHRIRSTAALLASPQDGEVLGAARALCRLFGKQGLGLGPINRIHSAVGM